MKLSVLKTAFHLNTILMNNSDIDTKYLELLREMELLKEENSKLRTRIEKLTAYNGRQTLLTDKQILFNLLVSLVEEAPFGVLVKKVNEKSIVYYNKAIANLFQLNNGRLLGPYWNNYFSSEWLRKIEKFDQECIQKNINKTDKILITTKEGETRTVHTIRHHPPLLDTEDEKFMITFFVDITQNEQCKLEIASALESDKLKSEFLANMSHEIRSPLNAIVGFSQLLEDAEDAEERHTYAEIIRQNNEQLLHLINDIIDFAKIESNKLTFSFDKVDVHALCKEANAAFSFRNKEGIDLIYEDPAIPATVFSDSKRLMQVLSNFLTNAIKFTDKGLITIGYAVQNDEVTVSVTDTGTGISPEHCEQIFDRFSRVNESRPGAGLGLSISKKLMEKLGGKIGVSSELNKGSVFWFSLPLYKS